ncbi:MAG: hypothetical protein U5K70_08775 [Halodesulfurarchaeum sp.]|nr:hypothetical protein [Halodesulfurarchaeum sp.]
MELGVIVVWLGLFLGLGALALPFASLLFSSVTDRGAGLAIPVAFAILAFAAYWIGQFRFGLGPHRSTARSSVGCPRFRFGEVSTSTPGGFETPRSSLRSHTSS